MRLMERSGLYPLATGAGSLRAWLGSLQDGLSRAAIWCETSPAMRRSSWIGAAAFWTAFGLLSGMQVWISMITHGHSVPRLVGFYLLLWLPWIGFTGLIAALARRWPVPPLRGRGIAVHLAAALLVGVVHSSYWIALNVAVRPLDRMSSTFSALDVVGFELAQVPAELVMYAGVLAVLWAGDFYRRLRERQVRTAHLEAALASARLQALELQLQPHFLFNTLNGISALVRAGRAEESVAMIAGLSDLLRYTLEHAGQQSVALEEESAMLRLYLEIQRTRFPDRLSYAIDVAPEARRAAVPTLILQPLAENAIRHGIATRAAPGSVRLRACRGAGELAIEMWNSGALCHGGEGIGLRNTRERLHQIYGDAGRLELREEGGGVLASLAIPWREIG